MDSYTISNYCPQYPATQAFLASFPGLLRSIITKRLGVLGMRLGVPTIKLDIQKRVYM